MNYADERLEQLMKEIKPGELILYDPVSFIPYISGKGPNRTCGDCGKTNCLELYHENEWGRFNHGVCHKCWVNRGIEECEGGLLGDPGSDGPSNREIEILQSARIEIDWDRVNRVMSR